MPAPDDAILARLRADLLDPRPAVRLAALDRLAELDWQAVRPLVVHALTSLAWPDRLPLLERLDQRFREIGTRPLLDELRATGPAGPKDPPVTADEREMLALLEAGLGLVLLSLGDLEAADRHCRRARELAPRDICRSRARADHHAGLVLLRQRDTDAAVELLRHAVEVYRRVDDRDGEAGVLDTLASAHFDRLELGEADYGYRRSLAIQLATGDVAGQATACGNLGRLAAFRGETEEALDFLYRSRRLSQQLGDDHALCVVGNQLAELYVHEDDLERAREAAAEAARAADVSPDPRDAAFSLRTRGRIAAAAGEHDAALEHARAAAAAFRRLGDEVQELKCELLAGEALRLRGDLAAAESTLTTVRNRCREIEDMAGEARACIELALLWQKAGREADETAALEEGLALAQRLPRSALREELRRRHAQVQAGRWLAQAGVAAEQVEDLVHASLTTGRGLVQLILQRKLMEEARLVRLLRDKAGIESVLREQLAGPQLRRLAGAIPRRVAERLKLLPIGRADGRLLLAMADPLDRGARLQVELITSEKTRPLHAPADALDAAIRFAFARPRLALDRHADAVLAGQALLEQAVAQGASDIHVEAQRDAHVVRFRVDGVLHEVDRLSLERARSLLNRLKIMSGMEIDERRRPQDGRARFERGREAWNLRLSTLPCMHGENLVVRILGQARALSLLELGLDDATADGLRRVTQRQEGMLLVVGPTGSGKSTTLQAVLSEIDAVERAVFTVEDPIEFEVAAFAQTQVNPEAEYGFAEALRALLRQDPNVILLGEIRDAESATIATRMALTGHLVLSTLHTYDAAAAVTRLVQMGVPSYMVAATVKGVLAQRLVRRLCGRCSRPEAVDSHWLRGFDPDGSMQDMIAKADVRGPAGCEACGFRGFAGRLPIFEYLDVNPEIGTAIRGDATEADLRSLARRAGMRPIAVSGLHRVAAGDTSPSELMRVL